MSGVAISQTHLQEALTRLHAAHSDSIGAPKVYIPFSVLIEATLNVNLLIQVFALHYLCKNLVYDLCLSSF